LVFFFLIAPDLARRIFFPTAFTGAWKISSPRMGDVESRPLNWEEGEALEQREDGRDSYSERGEGTAAKPGEVEQPGWKIWVTMFVCWSSWLVTSWTSVDIGETTRGSSERKWAGVSGKGDEQVEEGEEEV
jgi:hypothetical protein